MIESWVVSLNSGRDWADYGTNKRDARRFLAIVKREDPTAKLMRLVPEKPCPYTPFCPREIAAQKRKT